MSIVFVFYIVHRNIYSLKSILSSLINVMLIILYYNITYYTYINCIIIEESFTFKLYYIFYWYLTHRNNILMKLIVWAMEHGIQLKIL